MVYYPDDYYSTGLIWPAHGEMFIIKLARNTVNCRLSLTSTQDSDANDALKRHSPKVKIAWKEQDQMKTNGRHGGPLRWIPVTVEVEWSRASNLGAAPNWAPGARRQEIDSSHFDEYALFIFSPSRRTTPVSSYRHSIHVSRCSYNTIWLLEYLPFRNPATNYWHWFHCSRRLIRTTELQFEPHPSGWASP